MIASKRSPATGSNQRPWRSSTSRLKRGGVAPRHFQRRRAGVGGDDARLRPVALDRQRDRARAGAHVQHRGRIALERQVDEQLGFRARNEHRRVDRELEAVELLVAEDVGHRLARGSARRHFEELVLRLVPAMAFRDGRARWPRRSRWRRQAAGAPRARRCRSREEPLRSSSGFFAYFDQAASSVRLASCSAWYSAASASTISSISPSMMRSIL